MAIGRLMFVFASVCLSPGWLTSGETCAQSAGNKATTELELVAGEEVAHWSGLPVWGAKEAREHTFKLPLPLGVSGVMYMEKQDFTVPALQLGGQGGLLDIGGLVQVTEVKTEQTAWNVCLDAWVLPFLKLHAVAGYVDGRADVTVRPAVLPFGPKLDLKLDYEGTVLGLGGTLAAGFRPFKDRPTIVFGLMDLTFTKTFLDFKQVIASLNTVDVMVLSTRLGVRERILQHPSLGDLNLSLWGGATYQGVQEVMKGRLEILDLNFRAKVGAVNPWNTIIGSRLEMGEHFDLMIEFGFGGRQSMLLAATYRF